MSSNGICEANAVVNNLQTCKDAVSEIKKLIPNAHFKNNFASANWPKGCFLFANSDKYHGRVFFNEHHDGSNNGNARPICHVRGMK